MLPTPLLQCILIFLSENLNGQRTYSSTKEKAMEALAGAVAIIELLNTAADTAATIYKWAVKIYKKYQEDRCGDGEGE